MKPALLVDVDGVLNPDFPCNKPRARCKCHPGWVRSSARTRVGTLSLTLNPEHGSWLRDLANLTDAELTWASYWEDEANQWVRPALGLAHDWPYVPISPQYGSKHTVGEWKVRHVAAWAADGRPFVWFEDESDAAEVLAEHAADLGPHLLIPVEPKVGLTMEHVVSAIEWLVWQGEDGLSNAEARLRRAAAGETAVETDVEPMQKAMLDYSRQSGPAARERVTALAEDPSQGR